jgi:two-component system sensor histidine kinase DevS
MKFTVSPGLRFGLLLLAGFALALSAIQISSKSRQFNFIFETGQTLSSSHGLIKIEALDLISEPGDLQSNADLERFYQRQHELTQILSDSNLQVDEVSIETRPHSAVNFPALFWIQLIVGLGSMAIAGWIWALRPDDIAARLFALSGIGTVIFTFPSAIYTTRELAIDAGLFRFLAATNAVGASLFGISMGALFLVYPLKWKGWREIMIGQAAIFGIWTLGYVLKVVPEWANINLITVCEMFFICTAMSGQFVLTRRDPQSRASLVWLGISVLIGAGGFISLNAIPSLLHLQPMHQGYAFPFFLLIYVGLAAGINRYRLFEVGEWAFQLLFYFGGATILMMLDVLLVYLLGMERLPAFSFALMGVGILYLPLRDFIWRRLARHGRFESHELISESLHVAFTPSPHERASRWEVVLRQIFDPLKFELIAHESKEVRIGDDGLTLLIPSIAGLPELKISYPWRGTALFNQQSRQLATEMIALIRQAELSREAYDRGVSAERVRMAQDLHDDVGARLLTGLYLADDELRPTLQGAISDIRSIVSGMSGEKVGLGQFLADLRFEASRRMTAAKIELSWNDEEINSESLLDYGQQRAIGSAVREIFSNIIRHSKATRVEVLIHSLPGGLSFRIVDNGNGFDSASVVTRSTGFGLKNIQRRIAEAKGQFNMKSSDEGTRIEFVIP